jgi:hypothetical protein
MASRSRLGFVALGAALVLCGPSAWGDEAVRVAIVGSGPDGEAVASAVASRLAPPAAAVDAEVLRTALGSSATRLPAVAAKRRDKDAELLTRLRAAARSAHVDKAVLVHVEKARGKTVVHVWLVDAPASGSAPVDEEVRLPAGASPGDEADAVWNVVGGAFAPLPEGSAAPPQLAEASSGSGTSTSTAPASMSASTSPEQALASQRPDADTGPVSASSPHLHDSTRAGAVAVLGASLQGGSRHFSYVDRLTPTLRPYDLFVAPLVAIDGEIYPFTNSAIPVLAELGATAGYARAFGLASQDSGGSRVGTSWQAFGVGLRERLLLGTSFVLGIDAGYGDTSFEFDDPVTAAAQLPSVHYKFLRGGLDGRFVRGDLSVHGGASYLGVLSTGDFAALFPRASVGGVEVLLGVSDRITPAVELSLDVAYTRFFYNLLPQPGDAYVAGGALDEMAVVSLGLAYLF